LIAFIRKAKLTRKLFKGVKHELRLTDREQIVNSLLEHRLLPESVWFSLYKDIIILASQKTILSTRYYAKGLPGWLSKIPDNCKTIYLNIVKQSVMVKQSASVHSNVTYSLAESLPDLLLSVDSEYKEIYLDIIHQFNCQKTGDEHLLAEMLSSMLKDALNLNSLLILEMIQIAIQENALLGLKLCKNLTGLKGTIPQNRLREFLSLITETMVIDAEAGISELKQLSPFLGTWDSERLRNCHKVIFDISKISPKVGIEVSEKLAQFYIHDKTDSIDTYKGILFECIEYDPQLGKMMAKYLPALFFGFESSIDQFKMVLLSLAKEDLEIALSSLHAFNFLFTTGNAALIERFRHIVIDLIQKKDENNYYIKQIIGNLPVWLEPVTDEHRLKYLTLLHRLCIEDLRLVHSISTILPDLLDTMTYSDIDRFFDQGLKLGKENFDKAVSFFSLSSQTAIKKVDKKKKSVELSEVSHVLSVYATAHGGRKLSIHALEEERPIKQDGVVNGSYTDGKTIFLPEEITRYEEKRLNFKFYKLITAIEASKIEFGTYDFNLSVFNTQFDHAVIPTDCFSLHLPITEDMSDIDGFINSFSIPSLARDLFKIFEFGRVYHLLFSTYKGLLRNVASILENAFEERPLIESSRPVEAIIEHLCQLVFWQKTKQVSLDKKAEQMVISIHASFEDALLKEDFDVYHASWLTFSAYKMIFDYYTFTATNHPDNHFFETKTDQKPNAFIPETDIQDIAVDDNKNDFHDMPDMVTEGNAQKVDLPKENRVQDVQFDSNEKEPYGTSRNMNHEPDAETYNPLKNISFIGDLRADKVHEKEIELIQVLNDMKKVFENTGHDNLIKEINDLLTQQENDLPIINTEEILPLVKGENLKRLLEGYREKDVRLKDLIDNRVSGGADGAIFTGEDIHYYDEWDSVIGDYRSKWTTVHEHIPSPGDEDVVTQILSQNATIIQQVKQQFEQLNLQGMTKLKKQYDGDDFDIDALTEAVVESRTNNVPSDRLYIRRYRRERDVSVIFLVDLSNSTSKIMEDMNKTILDVERESLVIMAEALEKTGDKYAIYGFSGRGRHHCEFYIFKDFNQSFDSTSKGKIGWMKPLMSTRLGAALRHSISKLNKEESKSKLLFLITDGLPVDNDNYDGTFAQDDTKMALREARRFNIHPFCITVNEKSKEFYGDVYGDIHYTVIKDVSTLPKQLPYIYRCMTGF